MVSTRTQILFITGIVINTLLIVVALVCGIKWFNAYWINDTLNHSFGLTVFPLGALVIIIGFHHMGKVSEKIDQTDVFEWKLYKRTAILFSCGSLIPAISSIAIAYIEWQGIKADYYWSFIWMYFH